MSSRVAVRATTEPPKDWEDEYRRLKEKFDKVKLELNDSTAHNKMLQVKIAKLESELSKIDRGMSGPKASATMDREEKDLLPSLYEQINKHKARIAGLTEQNAKLTAALEKKTRQLELSKRTAYLGKSASRKENTPANVSEVDIIPAPNPRQSAARPHSPHKPAHSAADPLTDTNLIEVARNYKARLTTVEEQLAKLERENAKLRATAGSGGSGAGKKEADLENQLRDTAWRLQQLQTQYDYLVSKSSSRNDANKSAEQQIDVSVFQLTVLPIGSL